MAEDTRDEEIDVFEIDDFTAASEWERFIYRIEEIIGALGWKLHHIKKTCLKPAQDVAKSSKHNTPAIEMTGVVKSTCSNDNREQIDWKIQSEFLKFADFSFTLSHHKLQQIRSTATNATPPPPPTTTTTTTPTPSSDSDYDGLPQALIDSFDISYDFPPRAHCLSRWYGVKEFLLLSPTNKEASIDSESRTNLLWSSVCVALSNVKCELPVFIQVGNRRRLLHYGMCIGGGFRTSYEMIHLQYTPHECNHVQGMIETFKAKLGYTVPSPIHISIRFTYLVKSWPIEKSSPQPLLPEADDMTFSDVTCGELPFGAVTEPIRDLQLAVSWPSISSDMLNDDSNFSDLNPDHAPQWWLKARCVDVSNIILHQHVNALLQLCKQSSESTAHIVRALSIDNEGDFDGLPNDLSHALGKLVDSAHSLSPLQSVVSKSAVSARKVMKTRLSESPIPEPLLKATLEYLFPDANMTKEEALLLQQKLDNEQKSAECDAIRNRDKYRNLKSAPVNSMTYNLALSICMMNFEYGGLQGVSHLWHEFVLEMRYRFENNILIPRLAQTVPNLNYCLVHQKLQMLNYCIQRRQLRDAEQNKSDDNEFCADFKASVNYKDFEKQDDPGMSRDKSWSDLLANIEKPPDGDHLNNACVSYSDLKSSYVEDSDDEFFEAQEEMSSNSNTPPPTFYDTLSTESMQVEAVLHAEGVREETEIRLLKVNKALCIPITQEPPPLTEDVLLEQQEVMTQLGTSEEAARVRAQMQSASLMSDMEAFKAANPGCIVEDFVRWYSPNDWLPGPETEEEKMEMNAYLTEHKGKRNNDGWEFELDDEIDETLIKALTADRDYSEEGHLSLRMRVPGNAWDDMWSTARAIPIRRQKRLFDDTKEAEKVLHFLSSMRPSEIALHLFPVIIHACVLRISKEEDSSKIPSVLENIIREATKLNTPSLEDYRLMDSLVKDVLKAETVLARMQSLRLKFYPDQSSALEKNDEEIESFIHSLLNCSEVFVKGASKSRIGKLIKSLLIPKGQPAEMECIPNTKQFPQASGREYILRSTLPLPNSNSRHCPQRLFTVITPEEFRMAGTFTKDTNFI